MGKLKAIPSFNMMFTTTNTTKKSEGGILLPDAQLQLNNEQVVLAVGETCRYKVGDTIEVNFEHFLKTKPRFENSLQGDTTEVGKTKYFDPPAFNVDGMDVLYLSDRDIMWHWEKDDVPKEISKIKTV